MSATDNNGPEGGSDPTVRIQYHGRARYQGGLMLTKDQDSFYNAMRWIFRFVFFAGFTTAWWGLFVFGVLGPFDSWAFTMFIGALISMTLSYNAANMAMRSAMRSN